MLIMHTLLAEQG